MQGDRGNPRTRPPGKGSPGNRWRPESGDRSRTNLITLLVDQQVVFDPDLFVLAEERSAEASVGVAQSQLPRLGEPFGGNGEEGDLVESATPGIVAGRQFWEAPVGAQPVIGGVGGQVCVPGSQADPGGALPGDGRDDRPDRAGRIGRIVGVPIRVGVGGR
jgi:hypothetical protein